MKAKDESLGFKGLKHLKPETKSRVLEIWERVKAEAAAQEVEDEKRRAEEYKLQLEVWEKHDAEKKKEAAERRRSLKGKPAPKAGDTVHYIGQVEPNLTSGKLYEVHRYSQSPGYGRFYWIIDDNGHPTGLPRERLEVVQRETR